LHAWINPDWFHLPWWVLGSINALHVKREVIPTANGTRPNNIGEFRIAWYPEFQVSCNLLDGELRTAMDRAIDVAREITLRVGYAVDELKDSAAIVQLH